MTENAQSYELAVIRKLIQDTFTADDLKRFCQDRPTFRPILDYFGPEFDFMRMVDAVIEQCEARALFPDLLAAIQEVNPRQYERYSHQLFGKPQGRRVVNLRPLDMTHTFKDREREVQLLREYLADERVRLVSVVGRGGMGKTALVCHVLAELEGGILRVPGEDREIVIDGILYLSARSTGLGLERIYADVQRMLDEPGASRLAARWRHGETSPVARVGYLLEAMQGRVYLILLDNLENRLTEEGEIADEGLYLFVQRCLTQPSGARLIATARWEPRLPAAALPRARTISLQEGLPKDDASALLHELDPQGRLGLREALEGDLRLASELTQGIPRALELVASILDRDRTLGLRRFLTDEQLFGEQIVEVLFAEGYARLGDDERRVVEALAIFDRPMTEEAISFLLLPWFPGLDTHDSLRRLVSSYFVNVNRLAGEYHLHPLDCEYAYRQLPDGDEPNAYNRCNLELRAADYYASIRKPEDEWKTIDDLAPQLAEFEHRVRAGDYDNASKTLNQIGYHLYLWGHYARAAELREKLLGQLTDPGLRLANLGYLATAYRSLGHHERAIESYRLAVDLAREIGDRQSEGIWLGSLGSAYRGLGLVQEAIRLYTKALTIARDTEDRLQESLCLNRLGSAHRTLGQIDQALEFHEEAFVVACKIGDQQHRSNCLGSLGHAHRTLGRARKAIQFYEQALAIVRELGHRRLECVRLSNLGVGHYALGQTEQAIKFCTEGLTIAREIGDRWEESYQLLHLGRALLAARELAEAHRRCSQALALDVPRTGYLAAWTLGVVLLHQDSLAAKEAFASTAAESRALVDTTAGGYMPRYVLAAALMGRAVCSPRWADSNKRSELLAPALREYDHAMQITSAIGVIQDALRDLELIRAAGIEGLEPVFGLLNSALVQNRARGCVVGAAIGDALGMPQEFGPRRSVDQLLRDMELGRLPAGTFTDDTEMALALADSLLAHCPLDPADLAQRFAAWLQAGPDDVGNHTRNVLSRIAGGQPWEEAADAVQRQNPDSAGNGSVMRCWPVALAHWDDLDQLLADSPLQSRITHPHPECEAGSAFVNATIYYLLQGTSHEDAVAQALDSVDMPAPLRAVIEQAYTRSREELQNSGWVRHTLESAVWGLLTTDTFEDAVVQVVNLGNDADTAGTVVGALAGAAYGIDAISLRWREPLQGEWPLRSGTRWNPANLINLADRLVAR